MKYKHVLGFSLIIAGLPIAWVLREMLHVSSGNVFSYFFMTIGVVLFIRWFSILKLRLYGPATSLLLPGIFLGLSLLLSTLSGSIDDWMYLIFLLVVLFSFYTIPLADLKFLPHAMMVVSFMASVLTLSQVFTGNVDLIGQRLFAGDSNSPNQLAFVGGITLVTGIFLLNKYKGFKLIAFILINFSIFMGLAIVLLSGTRSVVLGLGLCASGYIFLKIFADKDMRLNKSTLMKVVRLSLGLMIIFLLILFLIPGDVLSKYTGGFFDYFQRGFEAYFYGIMGEESADIRHSLLLYAYSHLTFWGEGFKSLYVDFPLLQAFYDLGLLGGLLFLGVTVIVPVLVSGMILLSKNMNTSATYGALIYFLFLPNLFLHGQPYDYPIWLPIILFYGLTMRFSMTKDVHKYKISTKRIRNAN